MPAPDFTFRVEGLDVMERNLLALADQYGPRNAISALRQPMRRVLEPIRDNIENNTPEDTGALKQSVAIRISGPTRRLQRSDHATNGDVLIGRVGWFWRTGQQYLSHRAYRVEFGWVDRQPQRVLRDQLSVLQDLIETQFANELARNIERTATRLGRRQAAGTLRRR